MLTRTLLTTLAAAVLATAAAHADDRHAGLLVRFYDIGVDMHQLPELAPDQLPNLIKVVLTPGLRSDRGDFKPFEGDFCVELSGLLTVEQPGTYTLRLISDDGSRLWIDDRLVVDHDGLHGAVPKDGEVELTAGEHELRVAYFQSGGDMELELQWLPPGAAADKFEPIPAKFLSYEPAASRETAPGRKRVIPALRRGLPGDGTPVKGMHPSFVFMNINRATYPKSEWLHDGRLRPMDGALPSKVDPPVAWLPPAEAGTQYRDDESLGVAPYVDQRCVYVPKGESKRVFLDGAPNAQQGCVFRFGEANLQMVSSGVGTFEMLAVRAMTNGFEIEFTKPLDPRCGWEPESYYVEQWPFSTEATKKSEPGARATGQVAAAPRGGRSAKDTAQGAVARQSEPEAQARAKEDSHGATKLPGREDGQPPHRDGIRYPVKSASVSADRKRVFLEIPNLKESHVVYIRLLPPCYSEDGERPWSTEAWYTLNVIPQDRYGKVLTPPEPQPENFLTAEEKAAGWRLLFDGKTTAGWHGYRKDFMPDGWVVKDGCLVRVGPAGDISSDEQFGDFELKLEWRICAAGNSGIFYRVSEDYDWPFFTGPEFQVLDNAEHADGRNPLTSAGSNYALYAPVRDVTQPVGYFNQARIVARGPHVEHWLNGVKVVEYELWTDEWKNLVANSKFKAWPNYGLMKTGHIVLQDHGDMVWYRNIKIRPLDDGDKVTR